MTIKYELMTTDDDGHNLGFEEIGITVECDQSEAADACWLVGSLTAHYRGARITVKDGFYTDGASIPRAVWAVVGHPFEDYLGPAVIHDALYASQIFPRKVADQALRDLCKVLPVSAWKRRALYSAVRLFGGFAWRNKTEADIAIGLLQTEVEYTYV